MFFFIVLAPGMSHDHVGMSMTMIIDDDKSDNKQASYFHFE